MQQTHSGDGTWQLLFLEIKLTFYDESNGTSCTLNMLHAMSRSHPKHKPGCRTVGPHKASEQCIFSCCFQNMAEEIGALFLKSQSLMEGINSPPEGEKNHALSIWTPVSIWRLTRETLIFQPASSPSQHCPNACVP
jgi:hypothetical protein